jgi:hypothetical protein
MKNPKCLLTIMSLVLVLACFNLSVSGQTTDEKNRLANLIPNGSSIRWDVSALNAGLTVTISAPDGQVFRREFRAGATPEFALTEKDGSRLPDGQYSYELRLTPLLSPEVRKALAESRGKDDDGAALEREMRKRGQLPSQPLVQSGTFTVLNGTVIVGGGVEPETPPPTRTTAMNLRRLSAARPFVQTEDYSGQEATFILARAVEDMAARPSRRMAAHPVFPDVVTPDDAIIQGSLCVGLDCVNNESFGFDTIRLKENNTRIKFDDTSTSAGFPANDWQLTANDSASGGASKFSIEDITGSKVPFTITAGAATNSIFVDSTGRVGLRTSTPVLDIHANTSNTPAMRLEQNNSGGFTAQTWDIAGNEANFFVRDVTGGSRLPFRIRPGAPTSSVDINASGNVGIGTASPGFHVHVKGDGIQTIAVESTQNGNNAQFTFIGKTAGGVAQQWLLGENLATTGGAFEIFDNTAAQARFLINTSGNVGIGTTAPTDTLSVNGTASKPGGGSWSVFSDERLKNIRGRFTSGLNAVMQLQPIRYEYRRNNALGLNSEGEHIGFGAQALQKIIPEAVTSTSNGYLVVNNDPILWSMLNAIKEQQKEIEQLKTEIRRLQTHAGNRARHQRR